LVSFSFLSFHSFSLFSLFSLFSGHYIPHWTYQIFNNPQNDDIRKNLKGFLVGNPFTSYASGSIAMANVLWGLQLIPRTAWKLFTSASCEMLSHDAYFFSIYLPDCFAYLDALFEYSVSLNPCNFSFYLFLSLSYFSLFLFSCSFSFLDMDCVFLDALEFPVCPKNALDMKKENLEMNNYPGLVISSHCYM
jgi:hypothetical protein